MDRKTFFDHVRRDPFGGSLTQSQVDGLTFILDAWDADPKMIDTRWLAYCLATTFHETDRTMQPVEEYASGDGLLTNRGDGQWQYDWKTPKSYGGTCRVMFVRFSDGSMSPGANFKFR